ncbi:Paqr4 [Symbiodinium sp. KB8]|nr:Paqr4 [Symbiodinium sp. KB8]
MPVGASLRTLCQCHNETFNVFSHLVPLVLHTWGSVLLLLGSAEASEWSSLLFAREAVAALNFAASVAYHLCMPSAVTPGTYTRLLLTDWMTVMANVLVTLACDLRFSLPCAAPWMLWAPLVGAVALGAASGLLLPFRVARLVVGGLLGALMVATVWLRATSPLGTSSGGMMWVATVLMVALGFALNVSRLPERFPPLTGKLDYAGNSHNLMHVLTGEPAARVAQPTPSPAAIVTPSLEDHPASALPAACQRAASLLGTIALRDDFKVFASRGAQC